MCPIVKVPKRRWVNIHCTLKILLYSRKCLFQSELLKKRGLRLVRVKLEGESVVTCPSTLCYTIPREPLNGSEDSSRFDYHPPIRSWTLPTTLSPPKALG